MMSKSQTTMIDPVSPGEIIEQEYLVPLDMTARRLSLAIGKPENTIHRIISSNQRITPDVAIRLGRVLKTTPEFWLNLQQHYDLEMADHTAADELEPIATLA